MPAQLLCLENQRLLKEAIRIAQELQLQGTGDFKDCGAVDQGAGRGVIAVSLVWVGIKRLPK